MLIYNKSWIDNLEIQELASRWQKKKFISEETFNFIRENYKTGYKTPNIFARIGMFLLTIIILLAAMSLVGMLLFISSFTLMALIEGGLCYFFTERFIKISHYFRSGVTDVLLYGAITGICFGVALLISHDYTTSVDPIVLLLTILPIMVFAAIRFRDAFVTLWSYFLLLLLISLLVMKAGDTGKLILPFCIMIFSALSYIFILRAKKAEHLHYWRLCLSTLEAASLISFYAAGNYFTVRELSEMLLDKKIIYSEDISFAWFFYAFTLIVPILFIIGGLKRKNHLLIWIGILSEVAGILSIRYYYSMMPPETALTVGGILLIIIAWFSISYLKVPRYGLTYEEIEDDRQETYANIGAVMAAEAAARSGSHQQEGSKFGGGSSGGGGAGGNF